MRKQLHRWLLLISLTTTSAKDEDLPLCPGNMQYFPQNLPMHCRMPNSGDSLLPELSKVPTMPPLPPYFQNPSPGKPNPLPIPVPPFPGMQGPMPMPVPMVPGVPPHKLPVIVMPFYSPDPSRKKPSPHRGRRGDGHSKGKPRRKPPPHKKRYHDDSDTDSSFDTDTDTDTDTDSDTDTSTSTGDSDTTDNSNEYGWWRGSHKMGRKNTRRFTKKQKSRRRNKEKKELLTPMLQYVTKDGYVIFEKKITKNEAKDWLRTKNDAATNNEKQNNMEAVEPEDPKTDVEEIDKEAIDETTKSSTRNYSGMKHRYRIQNTLLNQPAKSTLD